MINLVNVDNPFSHRSDNGTFFKAETCDFRSGIIKVYDKPGKRFVKDPDSMLFGADVAEMIGFHATNIWPDIVDQGKAFHGYALKFEDCGE